MFIERRCGMKVILKKQPMKYLASVDVPTREKLYRALD
jgi:hypothetical protein